MARHSSRKTAPPTRYGFDPDPAIETTIKLSKRPKTTKAPKKSQSTSTPVPKPKKKTSNKPFGYRKKKRDPNALPKPRVLDRYYDDQGHPVRLIRETKIRDTERYRIDSIVRQCACPERKKGRCTDYRGFDSPCVIKCGRRASDDESGWIV